MKDGIEIDKRGAWVLAVRPRTLLIGVVPVLLGSALAIQADVFDGHLALLCLSFAILLQVGCNFANDYFDYAKGVDTKERIGFTRTVSSGLIESRTMKFAMIGVLSVGFMVGLRLMAFGGVWLLIVGVACTIAAVIYSGGPCPIGHLGLGELFVFIFFGLIAVTLTFYVQGGYFSVASFFVGTGIGLLAANVLLANNMRDKETDAKVGKRTLAVRLGLIRCFWFYRVNTVIAMGMLVLLVIDGLSHWVLMPLLILPWGIRNSLQLKKAKEGNAYKKAFIQTVLYLLVYGILLTPGIVIDK